MTSHDVGGLRPPPARAAPHRPRGHPGSRRRGGAAPVRRAGPPGSRRYVQDMPKVYRVEMTLGVSTDTHDQYGETTDVVSDFELSLADVGRPWLRLPAATNRCRPMTSARRHQGARLYDAGSGGVDVPREARPVTIYRIRIVRVSPKTSHADVRQPHLLRRGLLQRHVRAHLVPRRRAAARLRRPHVLSSSAPGSGLFPSTMR